MQIVYYGWARNTAGAIEQVRVVREGEAGHMRQVSQEYTGVVYPNARSAAKEIARLNGCAEAE